jgi:hypothetical protein
MWSDRCKVEGSGMRSVDWLAGDADADFQFRRQRQLARRFPKILAAFLHNLSSLSVSHPRLEAPSVASSINQDSLLTLSTSPKTRPTDQPRQHVGKGKGNCVLAQEEDDDQTPPNQCSPTDSPRRPEHVDSLATSSPATTLPVLGYCPSQQQPS